ACQGLPTAYGFGNDVSLLEEYAWHNTSRVWPVGRKKPNEWGLFDMHGNVWEWTQSAYVEQYPYVATDGRNDVSEDGSRVVRGGSWGLLNNVVRCAFRGSYYPVDRYDNVGFRIVLLP
ncbi:MAG: formylglycine-generating enzyme family protein, partial [Rhodothermales bacterium]